MDAIDGDALRELGAKYETLLALRARYTTYGPAPRPELLALASRFPGALRELDDLLEDELRSRARALFAAAEGHEPVAPWMVAVHAFHRFARGALASKRWLRGRRAITADVKAAFDEALATGTLDEDAGRWRHELDLVARPPGGRLMDVVFRRVGGLLGVSGAAAKLLVFGGGLRASRL